MRATFRALARQPPLLQWTSDGSAVDLGCLTRSAKCLDLRWMPVGHKCPDILEKEIYDLTSGTYVSRELLSKEISR